MSTAAEYAELELEKLNKEYNRQLTLDVDVVGYSTIRDEQRNRVCGSWGASVIAVRGAGDKLEKEAETIKVSVPDGDALERLRKGAL